MADIRYLNQFGMPGGFNITSGEPIDSRAYVADIEHIYNADNWKTVKPYEGLIVSAPDGQVRICVDAANYTSKDSWKEVGAGAGAIQVETYEEAIAAANSDKLGQIVYITTDGSFGEGESVIEYTAGAYIVTGDGALSKLGTTSVSGDIAGDVETLKGDVATLKTDVDALENVINGKDDEPGLISRVETLEGIDHTQYENVIETITVNGGEALAITDKNVDITIAAPVYNDAITVAEDGTVTDGDNAPKTSAVVTYVAGVKSGVDSSLETINGLIKSLDSKVNAIETWKLQVIPAEDKDKENFGLTEINAKTIYLVPKESTDTQNIYAEYVYVNSTWEKLGEFKADFDATDLQKSITELGTKVGNIETAIEGINTAIEGLTAKDTELETAIDTKIGKEDVMLDLSEATTEVYNLTQVNPSTPVLTGNFSVQSFEQYHSGGDAVEVAIYNGSQSIYYGVFADISETFKCEDGVITFRSTEMPESVPANQWPLSDDGLTIQLVSGDTLSLTMNVAGGDKMNTQDSLVYLNNTKADKSELAATSGELSALTTKVKSIEEDKLPQVWSALNPALDKLDDIAEGAQVNTIESITINNGEAIEIVDKNVNINIEVITEDDINKILGLTPTE